MTTIARSSFAGSRPLPSARQPRALNASIDATLDGGRQEVVFWCRGRRLQLDVRLDGQPLEAGVLLGDANRVLPIALDWDDVPILDPDEVPRPRPEQASLWLDGGASTKLPELPSPEEIEILAELGYAR